MDVKTEKLLQNLKSKKVGVFCDDSNLYHSYQKYGRRVDFEKFKRFLGGYCNLQFINYYIGIPDKSDASFYGTQEFLERIKRYVTIKEKKLKYTPVAGKFVKKADVDVEIVLDAVRTINDLDAVMVLSGDSDFYELKNYMLSDKGKIIVFVGYEGNMAWELRQCWHIYLDRIKEKISGQ